VNIFAVDEDPARAARALVDTHVVKMTLEAAQILSTALRDAGVEADYLYAATHRNHPCVR
jgi:hypothetical protein